MDFNDLKENTINIDKINHYYIYWPTSSNYQDQYSKEILNFKRIGSYFVNGKFTVSDQKLLNIFAAVFGKYFVSRLKGEAKDYLFCLVPPHKADTTNKTAIYYMSRFSKLIRDFFSKDVIIRTKTIEKLSGGGNRDLEVHLNSMKINENVKNKKVVVIDDVTTTGNSLEAAKKLLLEAGAKEVILFAFAKTRGYWYDKKRILNYIIKII